ncbi:MAG: hypothetical protein KF830_14035 [Planctomycetes bacterium]|nr:hypothetical protein [Planctomycetota bacterium]
MRILPLVLGTLLLQVPAHADVFWLSDPAKTGAQGSLPDTLRGVLIAESDEGYHVRIVGGEVILPKASVFKIEKDDLTIEAIVQAERDQADALAAADRERQMAQLANRRAREIAVVEASAARAAAATAADAGAAAGAGEAPAFDPVLGTYGDGGASLVRYERELQFAWSVTKDRRYMKLLRQARRSR